MKNLIEVLTKCQHDLDFLRAGLLAANKISSQKHPVANIVIKDLLASQITIETKLNELLACVTETKGI